MKISILGGGKWGTALVVLYAHKYAKENIPFWIRPESRFKDQSLADYVRKNRINPTKFPNIKIPDNVQVSDDLKTVDNSDIIISTIPSQHLKEYFPKLKDFKFGQFVNGSKGVIEGKPISFYCEKIMSSVPYAVLSGPNIASEIIINFQNSHQINPAFTTLAFNSKNVIPDLVSKLEFRPYLRLYPHHDIKSVEYCGILKQIYAIALGICVGWGYSGNTVAGLFHASGREIKRILEHLHHDPRVYDETYAGYPDLEVTYKFGRHGRIGTIIAKRGLESAKKELKDECIEGFNVLKSIYDLTKDTNLHLPILKELYSIIYLEKNPKKSLADLINS